MIIIIVYYYKNNKVIENYMQEEENTYSKNVCGTIGKECSIVNYQKNTCCDNLYCVRPPGDFYNKICSKTPDKSTEKSFKYNINNISSYVKGLGKNIYKNTFIEDCPEDEEGNEISNDYKLRNMCNNGFYKIHIPCMHKSKNNNSNNSNNKNNTNNTNEFPETTLFSLINDRDCIK
jgi:hypothetical protein